MMDLQGELAWMAEISKRARMPVTFQTLQADFAPDMWRTWIDGALAANRHGAWLVPQVAGKPASVLVGFESSYHPFIGHTAYRAIADLPFDGADRQAPHLRGARRDPRPRTNGNEVAATGPEAFLFANLHKLFPLGDPPDYEPAPEDSVAAHGRARGSQAVGGRLRPDAPA